MCGPRGRTCCRACKRPRQQGEGSGEAIKRRSAARLGGENFLPDSTSAWPCPLPAGCISTHPNAGYQPVGSHMHHYWASAPAGPAGTGTTAGSAPGQSGRIRPGSASRNSGALRVHPFGRSPGIPPGGTALDQQDRLAYGDYRRDHPGSKPTPLRKRRAQVVRMMPSSSRQWPPSPAASISPASTPCTRRRPPPRPPGTRCGAGPRVAGTRRCLRTAGHRSVPPPGGSLRCPPTPAGHGSSGC